MKTIYIKGRGYYKYGVRKGLERSNLKEGKDYIEGTNGSNFLLIWIREDMELRELKKAITAKHIFKYRIRFYNTIEDMCPKQVEEGFRPEDLKLIEEVRSGMLV